MEQNPKFKVEKRGKKTKKNTTATEKNVAEKVEKKKTHTSNNAKKTNGTHEAKRGGKWVGGGWGGVVGGG